MEISLAQQLACAKHELERRRRYLPIMLSWGGILASSARRELDEMAAIVRTLADLAEREPARQTARGVREQGEGLTVP
jgi:hypothetical protein